MEDKNLKNFLIGMISNVVRDIKENIFKVRVENQIKFPEEINVSNLKDIQEVSGKMTVKDLDKAIESLDKIEKKEIKFPEQPKEIEVKNLDKLINKKEIVIPSEFTVKNIDSVVKVLEDIKLKKYPEQKEVKLPDSFKISNLKDIPKTEKVDVNKMDNLLEAVSGIGSLNRSEKNPIPVRLSDGKYFYKALSEVIERAVSVGGVNNVGLRNTDNERVNPATEEKLDDVFISKNNGTISINNSTTTPLGVDEVFTGVADDIKDYAAINISIWADQASVTKGFSIEWSQDGTHWDEKMTVGIGKEKAESYEFGVRARYFRLVYTNGAIAQGAFRLQVIYHPVRTREGARCLCVDIDSREFAKSVRAVLAAKKPNGIYTNIHSTSGGNLKMAIEESELDFPIGAGSNGSVTLTLANIAYAIPDTASTKNHILILYNGSDTDMFVGYEDTNANGILLATGKTREFNLGISQQVYAYCASAGKVLTYSYKELNN